MPKGNKNVISHKLKKCWSRKLKRKKYFGNSTTRVILFYCNTWAFITYFLYTIRIAAMFVVSFAIVTHSKIYALCFWPAEEDAYHGWLHLLKSDVRTHQCWCILGKLLDLTCRTWPQWWNEDTFKLKFSRKKTLQIT